jgi:hypothetical protein
VTDVREARQWREVRRRFLTGGGNGVAVAVDDTVTEQAVVFDIPEPDTSYGVLITPSWDTTAYVPAADKATTGFTARFGTASGATDTMDYAVIRQ